MHMLYHSMILLWTWHEKQKASMESALELWSIIKNHLYNGTPTLWGILMHTEDPLVPVLGNTSSYKLWRTGSASRKTLPHI